MTKYFPSSLQTTLYDPIPNQSEVTYENYKKIKGFEDVGYFLINYVVSGGEVTKNVTRNDTIDIADVVVSLDNDVMARKGTNFKTKIANTTYYLDFSKDGDWTWGTSHPTGTAGTDYLPIAEVTTDSFKNVLAITDKRGETKGFRLKPDYMYPEIAVLQKKTSAFANVLQYQHLVVRKTSSSSVEYDDWADAIQAAINENDRVEFPDGTFGVSKPIQIRDWKIVYGNGRSTIIKAMEPMGMVLDVAKYVGSISYALIEKLYVDGNNLSSIGVKCVGFTNNSCMRNMWIEHTTECGLYVTKSWYCSFEKMQIWNGKNGINIISTAADPVNETGNVNGVKFNDIFIAFMTGTGVYMPNGSGFGMMFSNCTIEACADYGMYINTINTVVVCENVYMEQIAKNGFQVNSGYCLNLIGGYINVGTATTSRCVQVGSGLSKLIIKGTAMSCWVGNIDYMIYSEATSNEIFFNPLSVVNKRDVYYTGKFIGNIQNVISGNGTDIGYNMDSLTTRQVNLTASTSYGVDTNIKIVRGSSTKASVDAGRIYQYLEATTTQGGFGASQIALYGMVNDGSNTQKQVYGINNAFFTPYRLQLANYNTASRPTEVIIGSTIYDTNLKKPIVWNGTNWTDYMGNIV